MRWSRNQAKLYMMAEHPGHTYAVHGPVRSGKTVAAVWGFCRNACTRFAGHDFIIASRTEKQLEAIIITYMREYAQHHEMVLRERKHHFVLDSFLNGPSNRFWRFIGKDKSSAYTVSGVTMAGALIDECEDIPQPFIGVCRERCATTAGRKVVLVTNPGGPQHWYKQELIDKADGQQVMNMPFLMDDNPSMTPEHIGFLKTIHHGSEYDRRIRGLWVAKTGQVYPHFRQAVCAPPDGKPDMVVVSMDHAESSVTHALRFEVYAKAGAIWCADEWWNDHASERMDDTDQAFAIIRALNRKGDVDKWYCDPAAMKFAHAVTKLTGYEVTPADNAVNEGIQKTSQWLATGTLKISPGCKRLIGELDGYIWDEKAAERGEDKPLKRNDHGCDALRYYCYSESRGLAERVGNRRLLDASAIH